MPAFASLPRSHCLYAGIALCASVLHPGWACAQQTLAALASDARNWPIASRDYANTRFSPLDQINTANVDKLKLAWSFSVGANRGQEAAPLVINGVMYVVGPYDGPHPNQVFALDASTGDIRWSYAPKPEPAAKGVACCDVVSRGLAYDNGKIFLNTLDDYMVALDAKSGKELWVTKLGDINLGETMTMAPLAVKGKVFAGNSGGEMGVRGWLTAVDQNSGKIAWRAYSTGPDSETLIGPEFSPHYDWMKGKDLGVTTWPADHWRTGGGTVWGWLSYDPETNLLFYGTGNPGPWNSNQRPGDNLWTSTVFARDADTGAARWAYQMSPHDLWDHDEVNENMLLDLPIHDAQRKVLVHPGRNGYMYVIDRASGEVLSADPYDTITVYKGVDLKSGRIEPNDALKPVLNKTVENICPAPPGAKDWQPMAWSPRTQLLYVPHQHLCANFNASEVSYIAGTPFVGATVDMYAGPGGHRGEFLAWDPVKRAKAWSVTEKLPVWSGALVTAGDVVFYGTMDRMFKALDARTGQVLWQIRAPSGFVGQPVAYVGGDGVEYIAILSGVGGWPGVIASAEIDPRVRNSALGFVGATQDLPLYTVGGSTLLVFSLGDASVQHATPAQ
ncbi:MAG: PQQ-dependent dehydrogenase, methanol/ethanol family [Methylocystis sp.]|uniref:PQQ-dependent dehydrogenase, methanol/ethanol family n=1 Tax=Methylocystis sp. TaxID=1911079 RepID=UPI003DA6837E